MSVEENIKIVRRAIEAFNTGNTSNADQFISPDYVNRESQSHKDSYRSKLKETEEFTDTIRIYVVPFLIFTMKNKKLFLKATR